MSFLPDDYQAPKASNNYMKLVEGENRVRIMSMPVLGWEDWKDKKPMRFRMDQKPNKSIDPKKPIKHFWAFIVFNYSEEQIQIMQVNQTTVRKSLEALCRDKDWGAPYGYDIKIMKTGEGVDTEYAINPVPHKPIDPYLVTCFKEKPINLDALFTGEDPFSKDCPADKITPLGLVGNTATGKIISLPKEDSKINQEQINNLLALFEELPEDFKNNVNEFMKKQKIAAYADIPLHTYDRIVKQALAEKAKEKN